MTGEAAPEGEKQKAMSRVAPKFDSCGYVYRSDTGSPLTLVAGDTGRDRTHTIHSYERPRINHGPESGPKEPQTPNRASDPRARRTCHVHASRRGDDGARRTPNPNAEARTPGERPCMQLAGEQRTHDGRLSVEINFN